MHSKHRLRKKRGVKRMYRTKLRTIHSGFVPGQSHCWTHARAGVVREGKPSVVLTMSPLKLSGSDVFEAVHQMRSENLGETWTAPLEQQGLSRRPMSGGSEEVVCDFTPKWHAATGTLLGTGQTVAYRGDDIDPNGRKTSYAVYDPASQSWGPWKTVEMPEQFETSGAGSAQRADLDNGDILLPIYYKKKQSASPGVLHDVFYSCVVRCRFDGETLQFKEKGADITYPSGRGYYEPSITYYQGEYFITLRADDHGAVSRSKDGLNFEAAKKWRWDDGTIVPTYNTQQHWVTHSDALYLAYTRKAENNDHVFRHRAPLFMAEVDPERMCLIRETERIIVPEHGARLGNFGVVDIHAGETWVTVAEWMQNAGEWGQRMRQKLSEKYSDEELASLENAPHMSGLITKFDAQNRIFAARILWEKPNRLVR